MPRANQRSLSSFAPVVPQPPANDPPLGQKGQHSDAWAEFFQKNTDVLNELTRGMRLVGRGVTDGSDAQPGYIGEVLTATGSGVGLSNTVIANVASLDLPAGDWDVTGNVAFTAGSGTHVAFGCGIGAIDTMNQATFPSSGLTQQMNTSVRRYSLSGTVTVWLVAQATFSGGVNASGTVRARRMR